MNALYDWMMTTWVNRVVLMYPWTWPTLETLHFLGACLLLGALLVMDLRIIGFQRAIPARAVHALTPIAMAGFIINLVTGLGFVFGEPYMYAENPGFWTKMTLIGLAALNYLLFTFKIEPQLEALGPNDRIPILAKGSGIASLALWFGVLAYGRLLPYVGTTGG